MKLVLVLGNVVSFSCHTERVFVKLLTSFACLAAASPCGTSLRTSLCLCLFRFQGWARYCSPWMPISWQSKPHQRMGYLMQMLVNYIIILICRFFASIFWFFCLKSFRCSCLLTLVLLLVQMSFEPLVQALDIDNLIRLFTAVLLERRVLLRANK